MKQFRCSIPEESYIKLFTPGAAQWQTAATVRPSRAATPLLGLSIVPVPLGTINGLISLVPKDRCLSLTLPYFILNKCSSIVLTTEAFSLVILTFKTEKSSWNSSFFRRNTKEVKIMNIYIISGNTYIYIIGIITHNTHNPRVYKRFRSPFCFRVYPEIF